MNEIEKDKNIDENKLLALCQPVFTAMFKKEQMKDLNILMKCLESFIAIKNKKFNEINQEFFTIMGIS